MKDRCGQRMRRRQVVDFRCVGAELGDESLALGLLRPGLGRVGTGSRAGRDVVVAARRQRRGDNKADQSEGNARR